MAVADVDERRLNHAADQFRIEKRYTDFRGLLAEPRLAAVGVFVPVAYHYEIGMAVLKADKHLLMEKPMCLSLDHADALIEQAGKTEVKAMVGFNRRWHRLIRRARKTIAEQTLGAIHLVNTASSSGQDFRSVPEWRVQRSKGGGCLIEDGSHFYDLWRFLLGDELEEVIAVSNSVHSDDEPAVISARTQSGILLNCVLSDFLPNRHETEIFGEKSVLSLSPHRFEGFALTPAGTCSGDLSNRIRGMATFLRELPNGILAYRHGGEYNASFKTMWQHFADCIQHDKPVECGLEDGRRALQITLAAVQSAATRSPVRVASAPRTL
jgi:predicted dehydrogenase